MGEPRWGPAASVIVRTFESASTVEFTLASVRAQTYAAEVVVVDSGSTDGTLDLVAPYADRIVHLTQEEFTFGRALNVGAAAAAAPVHVALSSHTCLPHPHWLETAVNHIAAGAVAAGGAQVDGQRHLLTGPLKVTSDVLERHPHWGVSHHASAWSADVWREHPFDETLPAAEDREWSLRAVHGHRYLVVDPVLFVPGLHRRTGGVRSYYHRLLREMSAMNSRRVGTPFGVADALAEWAARNPHDGFTSDARRFGRTRLVEVAARYVAGRRARRRA